MWSVSLYKAHPCLVVLKRSFEHWRERNPFGVDPDSQGNHAFPLYSERAVLVCLFVFSFHLRWVFLLDWWLIMYFACRSCQSLLHSYDVWLYFCSLCYIRLAWQLNKAYNTAWKSLFNARASHGAQCGASALKAVKNWFCTKVTGRGTTTNGSAWIGTWILD